MGEKHVASLGGMTRRAFFGGTAVVACGAALAGCGTGGSQSDASGSAAQAGDTRTVTIAMSPTNEPDAGFDPCVAWGCGEHVHEPLIQSTLITTKEDMSFECDLATGYECSEDGLTWTFALRDDAKFSDGKPVLAGDAAFTINTIRESKNAQADLSMVEEATAPDDATLVLRLSKPYNALLYTLAVVGIVPEHAYGADYGSAPIGSGRYVLAQWDHGQQVILEANPSYYGEAPQMERVVVVFMEEDAALAAVRSGQVDMAYTSATLADQQVSGYTLESYDTVDSRGFQMPVIPSGSTREDGPNTYPAGNDVTCNLEVRRAVNLVIDRQAIVNDVLGGHGSVAYSIGDGMPWASEDMRCEQDVSAAQALLEEAGWTKGADGIYARDGLSCAFDLYYPTGDSVRQAMANALADQLGKAGISVTPHGGSWDDLYPHEFSDPIMWGWGSNSPSDVYELNYSAGTMNFSCYENPATDAYLDEALATKTVEESFPLWQRAEWDGTTGIAPQGDATWAWIANVSHLYFKREGLKVARQKLQPHGHGWSVLNNVDLWSWE
ncbi:ABC transporter substrate-binding protein [Paratractidigestivibacter faecalis]|uniref:ABC transporter substrate-binding protein n=1 Tax=Paratractidigestivibacter faecalis TaxID=2292441 RepID=UPI000E3C769A|nr:ABC transporter substrate-binding protein [Paratractidigestivibacter faecalis]